MPLETTANYIRARVEEPGKFEEESFRTIIISMPQGIRAVIGHLKGQDTTTVQSYLFDRKKEWTEARAKKWIEDHGKHIKVEEMW
jgi:hypothetical protein